MKKIKIDNVLFLDDFTKEEILILINFLNEERKYTKNDLEKKLDFFFSKKNIDLNSLVQVIEKRSKENLVFHIKEIIERYLNTLFFQNKFLEKNSNILYRINKYQDEINSLGKKFSSKLKEIDIEEELNEKRISYWKENISKTKDRSVDLEAIQDNNNYKKVLDHYIKISHDVPKIKELESLNYDTKNRIISYILNSSFAKKNEIDSLNISDLKVLALYLGNTNEKLSKKESLEYINRKLLGIHKISNNNENLKEELEKTIKENKAFLIDGDLKSLLVKNAISTIKSKYNISDDDIITLQKESQIKYEEIIDEMKKEIDELNASSEDDLGFDDFDMDFDDDFDMDFDDFDEDDFDEDDFDEDDFDEDDFDEDDFDEDDFDEDDFDEDDFDEDDFDEDDFDEDDFDEDDLDQDMREDIII